MAAQEQQAQLETLEQMASQDQQDQQVQLEIPEQMAPQAQQVPQE
jgi:hypothetical protein